jgi:sugar phosphate isomerase/epimerase
MPPQPPKLSVCQWSMPRSDLRETAGVLSDAGFRGIGLCEELLGDRDSDSADVLRAFGLEATVCQTRVRSIFPFLGAFEVGETSPAAREAEIRAGIHRMAPFQPDCYVVLPGVPPESASRQEADQTVIDALQRLGDEAASLDVTIAFEPVHPTVRDLFGYVTSIRHGLDILEAVDHPAVGLLVDTWHLAEDPQAMTLTVDETASVAGVHLGDRAATDEDWRHRKLPGYGCLPISEVVAHLVAQGYSDWFDIEIISDDGRLGAPVPDSYWHLDPEDLARALWDGALKAFPETALETASLQSPTRAH